MTEATEKLTVSINDRDDVSALLYAARKKGRVALILGHGTGASQLSPAHTPVRAPAERSSSRASLHPDSLLLLLEIRMAMRSKSGTSEF